MTTDHHSRHAHGFHSAAGITETEADFGPHPMPDPQTVRTQYTGQTLMEESKEMPRKPRTYLSGIPCHVTQRGNNRNACFHAVADYRFFLECMRDAASRFRVAIHAYVLMANHIHLLVTPADESGISRMIQSVGRRYVQYVNRKYNRSGTLWETRHKASLVDAEAYLLACYRYIELNPLRAGIVSSPEDYPWSSYLRHAYGDEDKLVTDHPVFDALGVTSDQRSRRYRELAQTALSETELQRIRSATRLSAPLGGELFKRRIKALSTRTPGRGKRGRTVAGAGSG